MDSDIKELFPLETIPELKQHPEYYSLLERIPFTEITEESAFPIVLDNAEPDEISMVFLDTETTGLYWDKDEIIELGMVRVRYSPSKNRITGILAVYDEFEQPQKPLSPEVVKITGITEDMVRGRSFDEERIVGFLRGDLIIIAHNAAFDRPFVEKRFGKLLNNVGMGNLRWGCSLAEIPWKKIRPDLPARKLEVLANSLGYFYEAHRACVDSLALLWILYCQPVAMRALMDSIAQTSYYIEVTGVPFYSGYGTNPFRTRGYRYLKSKNAYSKMVYSLEEKDIELGFIAKTLGRDVNTIPWWDITASDRYRFGP